VLRSDGLTASVISVLPVDVPHKWKAGSTLCIPVPFFKRSLQNELSLQAT